MDWYPESAIWPLRRLSSYFKSPPVGVVVHYTAGGNVAGTHQSLQDSGFGYHFIIGRNGTVYQLASFEERVSHAGKSVWNGYKNLNDHFLGIAIASYGLLKERNGKFYAWPNDYNFELDPKNHRISFRQGNLDNSVRVWEGATDSQVKELEKLLGWLIAYMNIKPDNICGHDECSLAGKMDPGGVLPYPMYVYRDKYREIV